MKSVIDIARECGAFLDTYADETTICAIMDHRALAAFAERIRVDERERCAKKCEGEAVDAAATGSKEDVAYNLALKHAAAAIREPDQAGGEG